MIDFLKSLRFWRYRQRYFALLAEQGWLAHSSIEQRMRAKTALTALKRLQEILAPYGKRILTGQAKDTEGFIRLPTLEFEMARAFIDATTRMPSSAETELSMPGFVTMSWCGRSVQRVE